MADVDLQPSGAIARKIGIPEGDLETYGRYTAKISHDCLGASNSPPELAKS